MSEINVIKDWLSRIIGVIDNIDSMGEDDTLEELHLIERDMMFYIETQEKELSKEE